MAQQLVINVENPSMVRTLRNLFKNMEGVSILPSRSKKKNVEVNEDVPDQTKEEILAGIDHAFKDLKLNLEGKLEFRPAEELLNEL